MPSDVHSKWLNNNITNDFIIILAGLPSDVHSKLLNNNIAGSKM